MVSCRLCSVRIRSGLTVNGKSRLRIVRMVTKAIDFCVGWGPWPDEPFADMIRQYCRDRGLTCVFCKDQNVRRVIKGAATDTTPVRFHLDLNADYEDAGDVYARLGYVVKDSGAVVVNEPDPTRLAANKTILHYRFEQAGIPVPYTVIVRNWEPDSFALTAAERKKLGRPFIIKPARGYGKRGVVKVDSSSLEEIVRARRFDKGDDFLFQQLVEPEWFGHHRGWFRVFYIFGEVIPCWWDNLTEHYACVTVEDFEQYDLLPLCDIVWQIARTASMNFFTTELAIVGRGAGRRYLAIDYVNDHCDTTLQSHSHCGVPDRVVSRLADRLAEEAWRVKKGLDTSACKTVWLS